MKRKNIFVMGTATTLLTLAVGATVYVAQTNRNLEKVKGTGPTYVLNANRSVTSTEVAAGEMSFATTNDNPILLGFDSDKASVGGGLITLASYGTLFNKTAITGITKIEGTLSAGKAVVSYGIHPEVLSSGSALIDSANNNGEFTINLDTPSDYFKLDCYGGNCIIDDLKFTYSCSAYNFNFETTSWANFSEGVVNPNASCKRFTYFTTTTTAHEIALRAEDGNRATAKVTVTIGDGSNPTVSVGSADDWNIVNVGNGVYYVDIRIGGMGAGQNNNPAVNVNFRTANTAHAKVAILDPYTFNNHDGTKDDTAALFSNIGADPIEDPATSNKVLHFFTDTHTNMIFELRTSDSNRRTNKCQLAIGDGSAPTTSGLSAGWSLTYVGNGTYLVNIPINKMGSVNASHGDAVSVCFRSGAAFNYADILID